MGRCNFCDEEILTLDLFRCSYCGGYFCPDHRHPPNHSCPNIAGWMAELPPTAPPTTVSRGKIVSQDKLVETSKIRKKIPRILYPKELLEEKPHPKEFIEESRAPTKLEKKDDTIAFLILLVIIILVLISWYLLPSILQ